MPTPGPAPGPVGVEASPGEGEAKTKIESTRGIVEQMKGEGMDVTSAEKLLQLATSCLYSGDYERALKYANKAGKVSKDIRERAAVEQAGHPAEPSAPAEDPQQKEVVATISAVQSKIGPLGESVEKSEVENLLRLATSFVRSKSYSKALRYAKQAEEKANSLAK
jgi:tetratricopeptide (TPR) repeat protein